SLWEADGSNGGGNGGAGYPAYCRFDVGSRNGWSRLLHQFSTHVRIWSSVDSWLVLPTHQEFRCYWASCPNALRSWWNIAPVAFSNAGRTIWFHRNGALPTIPVILDTCAGGG